MSELKEQQELRAELREFLLGCITEEINDAEIDKKVDKLMSILAKRCWLQAELDHEQPTECMAVWPVLPIEVEE